MQEFLYFASTASNPQPVPVLLPQYTGFAPELKLWVASRYKNAARIFMTGVSILPELSLGQI
jgi:hypothetical protein